MIRPETAAEICARFAPAIGAAVLREKPAGGFRWKGRYLDLVVVVTSREEPEALDPSVPPEVRPLRESYREVYKVLAELRAELGPEARVTPLAITRRQQAHFDRAGAARDASEHTVNHALAALEKARAVHWTKAQAWLVGPSPRVRPTQLKIDLGESLPSDARQTAAACSPAEIANDAPEAHDSRASARGANGMFGVKTYIWVPVDPDEGVVIDAKSETRYPPTDKGGELEYRDRSGRTRTRKACRAELVRTEGRYAVARLGRSEVHVLVLGDWHLAGGLCEPAPEPAATA